MRVLVTGGTGFLGKHLLPKLTNYEVWAPSSRELNVTDPQCVWNVIGFNPDVILHMAALCGGILANKNSPADFLHKNIDMASNIFHCAQAVQFKRILNKTESPRVYTLGSVCAYPKFCPVPFKEDDLWNGYPEETNAPYGMAKRLQLMLGQTYRQQYGIGGAHLIPVNLYGEHDHFDLTNSHVIPALIRKFDTAIEKRLSIVECWGTGEATREFLYAGDAAEAIAKAVTTGFDTDLPINLGTGKDISIKDLAELVGDLTGFQGKIVFNGAVSDGQPKRMLDVSRAREMLSWTAKTDFKTGLLKTIQWFRDNKQAIVAADAS
jgi:GDP-L-fucose synthase